jgi:ATP-dependent DNA helicase RecQ
MEEKGMIYKSHKYLEEVYGMGATFRHGQLDAIIAVLQGKRALVVQKTGWGKSLIYLLSTKILRKEGKGLSIVISPLLALINNQIESADAYGLIARSINSNNEEQWEEIIQEIGDNKIDVLFISPERLANEDFNKQVLSQISNSVGMLVIDEAHCISDWGHDFRPDYRRIVNIVKFLPPNVPLLATTATANDRVVKDISEQVGKGILIQRGPLIRESLSIQIIHLDRKEERLAWLSENIGKMFGTGIVYCLTKHDSDLVSGWLK